MVTGLVNASMESFQADWRAANGDAHDVPAEVEVPSVDVLDMDDLAFLLEKDAGWTQDVGHVKLCLVEACRRSGGERIAFKASVPRAFNEVGKIGRELLSANLALGPVLGKPNLVSLKHRLQGC